MGATNGNGNGNGGDGLTMVPSGRPVTAAGVWDDADFVLPRGVAQDFIGTIEQQSVALQLGRVLRMSEATEVLPIIAFRPSADFVEQPYGGRKPVTEIRWSAVQIRPAEIAATLAVPNAWIQDAQFDVEGQVERELANAVAYRFDDAVLWGNSPPPQYPPGGVIGNADTAGGAGAGAIDSLSEALAVLEGKGILPDGIAAGPAIGVALRTAYSVAGALPGQAPADSLWGIPVRRSMGWDGQAAQAIVGGWNYLAIGIREDIRVARSDQGVLMDGSTMISAFQDNVTLVKIWARIGVAIGKPSRAVPGEIDPQDPFVAVSWEPGSAIGFSASSESGGGQQQQASAQQQGASRGPGRPRKESSSS